MRIADDVIRMAEENNGMVSSAMVTDAGYSRGHLKYLVDKGRLENVSRGVYMLPSIIEDTFALLQHRFKRGIFSHETSLFLHDLTDRTPNYCSMTFPARYNISEAKKGKVICTQVIEALYEIGIERITSPWGNMVNVYSMERTLCDILRPRSRVDMNVTAEAFKRYVKRKDRNLPQLSEYSEQFKVENKVRSYLEVLL